MATELIAEPRYLHTCDCCGRTLRTLESANWIAEGWYSLRLPAAAPKWSRDFLVCGGCAAGLVIAARTVEASDERLVYGTEWAVIRQATAVESPASVRADHR